VGQTVTAEIVGYSTVIQRVEWSDKERIISVVALVADSNGNVIGEMDTDVIEFARNLPLALVKAYQIHRQVEKGTLVPDTEF
jgi:hypothetical protein